MDHSDRYLVLIENDSEYFVKDTCNARSWIGVTIASCRKLEDAMKIVAALNAAEGGKGN